MLKWILSSQHQNKSYGSRSNSMIDLPYGFVLGFSNVGIIPKRMKKLFFFGGEESQKLLLKRIRQTQNLKICSHYVWAVKSVFHKVKCWAKLINRQKQPAVTGVLLIIYLLFSFLQWGWGLHSFIISGNHSIAKFKKNWLNIVHEPNSYSL